MRAIERAKAHYEGLGTRRIEVKDWGLTVHFTPMTLRDRAKLDRRREGLGRDLTLGETAVEILLVKAKDENGQPLFSSADRDELLGVSADEVMQIANAITTKPKLEDAEKN